MEKFKNFFGKSQKNLGKLREIFLKVSRNIAKILEKYYKNLENYCQEFEELFHKILNIISSRFENHFKKFWRSTVSENIKNNS